MTKKIGPVALLLLLASVVAAAMVYAARSQRNSRQPGERIKQLEQAEKKSQLSIPGAVELAKARGERRVVIQGLPTLYLKLAGSSEELDGRLSDYTVVIGKLVDQAGYKADDAVIRTWNKFKVVDNLSQGSTGPPYFPWPPVPDRLLPLKEDEILVHTHGGVVNLDGVEVIQSDIDVPPFKKSQKYLLVLAYDPSARKGFLEIGPQSLLPVNDDGSLDEREDKYPLQQLVKERYGGSLPALKQRLARRPNK